MNKTRTILLLCIVLSLVGIFVFSSLNTKEPAEKPIDTNTSIQDVDKGDINEHISSDEKGEENSESTPKKDEDQTNQKQEQANQSSVPDSSSTNVDTEGNKEEIKEPIVETIAISICITGLNKEVLAQDIVQIEKGSSAFDALAYTCNKYNMAIQTSGFNKFVYVQAINGLKEKEHGAKSGWKYNINGEYVSSSSGAYILKENDVMEWYYEHD